MTRDSAGVALPVASRFPSPGRPESQRGGLSAVDRSPESPSHLDRNITDETWSAIEQRVLWLAVRMVDYANHDRVESANGGRTDEYVMKVGGHQASSASMISIMTALWFGHLTGIDKVATKPHASPVLHAINYLLGNLGESSLRRLRDFGGLQAYPSRTKDPDVTDFSTGSVGLGAVAPLFAAATRRYVDVHFGPRPTGVPRFVALVGDAELDEGNIWEALADPALQGLSNVMWVIDVNRQSLDRVVPGMKIATMRRMFDELGWHAVDAKYGRRLQAVFALPGGEALRAFIDEMPNEEYQALLRLSGAELREAMYTSAAKPVQRILSNVSNPELAELMQNLGGHDVGTLLAAYQACDRETTRPSVVFAYTIKGRGLPIAGDPLNHSAMLTRKQVDGLRTACGLDVGSEWDRFTASSAEAQLCRVAAQRLVRPELPPRVTLQVPIETGVMVSTPVSTQETFGRILGALAKVPEVATRIVTTSPDVSISTNLGGWINRMGVFHPNMQPDLGGDAHPLKWQQGPSGHHIELGISEMNLFMMLHALGLGHELHGETLLPVGTVYDPFVCRGLDALIYALYSGARFVVAGTPAGITLAPEGGAHQSTVTASLGIELPGVVFAEPGYAVALDWILCDGLARIASADGPSLYLRLSTRQVDQEPFLQARERIGAEALRRDVLAGAYRLVEPDDGQVAQVVIAVTGAVVSEAVRAAQILTAEGVPTLVLDITSPDRVFHGWKSHLRAAGRRATRADDDHHLGRLIRPGERGVPIVTVHDAASHALAFLGSVFGVPAVPVGVDEFGQSGALHDLYSHFDLLPEQLVNAALVAIER
jgi:pyruvate dehydrogenase E1 component